MNPPTIIGLCAVATIVIAIIIKAVIDKKHGKGGCSCGCGGCANKEFCHPKKEDKDAKEEQKKDLNTIDSKPHS